MSYQQSWIICTTGMCFGIVCLDRVLFSISTVRNYYALPAILDHSYSRVVFRIVSLDRIMCSINMFKKIIMSHQQSWIIHTLGTLQQQSRMFSKKSKDTWVAVHHVSEARLAAQTLSPHKEVCVGILLDHQPSLANDKGHKESLCIWTCYSPHCLWYSRRNCWLAHSPVQLASQTSVGCFGFRRTVITQ